jgi:AbrB family looped-hinge helix DNA binding protein
MASRNELAQVVSTKGQVVIPVELREELGIEPGTQIRFERHKEGLLLRPVTKEFIQKMRGYFGKGAPSLEDIRKHEHRQDEPRQNEPRRKDRP